MNKIQKIEDNVELLLTKYAKLRSPFQRKQAHLYYWKEFDGLSEPMFKKLIDIYPKLTSAETISRCIRSVQDKNKKLKPTPEMEKEKYNMSEEYRENYSPNNTNKINEELARAGDENEEDAIHGFFSNLDKERCYFCGELASKKAPIQESPNDKYILTPVCEKCYRERY